MALHWPTLIAEVCQGNGECVDLELGQQRSDSATLMPYHVESGDYVERISHDWRAGAAAAPVPSALIQPNMRITLDVVSKTVGDTVTLAQFEIEPIVLEPRTIDITVVPIIAPNPDCDCHEWPDSAYALHRVLRDEPETLKRGLFSQTEHWYPAIVRVRWRDTPVYSRVWGDEPRTTEEVALDDLSKVSAMRRNAGAGPDSYWIGICTVSCQWGFTGGMAYMNGRASVAIPAGRIVAHEIGHNLGLRHPDQYNSPSVTVDALSVGVWRDGTYSPAPLPLDTKTFMHSFGELSIRVYPGIAPWQMHHLLVRLAETPPEPANAVVVH